MNSTEKTWHGLRAASLSIIAGVGHLYLGEKRGYLVFLFGMLLLIISRAIWRPAELFYISLAIFSAVDAYSIAKRGHGLM